MRLWLSAIAFVSTVALGQTAPIPGQQSNDGPSITTPGELPLTYVGADDRFSIGIDKDGNTQGELMGVFARNDEHAVVAQAWWQHGGAGGFQTDYNWLFGVTPEQVRQNPDSVTVAKLSFGMNQDDEKNRQAAAAFAIERKQFFLDAYIAAKASGSHDSGAQISSQQSVQNGTDAVGNFTQTTITTLTTQLQSQAYNYSVGIHGGHFSDALGARFQAGVDFDNGNQRAHETRASVGIDKYIGTRGWSVSALAEHANEKDPVLGNRSDNRWWLMLRYEFGGSGAFAKADQNGDSAWITRALGEPVIATPHTLHTYTSHGKVTTTTTPGGKQYTAHRPVAQNDSASVVENSQNNTINVLANDSDADGNPITITAVTAPAHGSAQVAAAQINYTPAAGYVGSDSFTYTISDNKGLTATASVAVTITAGQSPVARNYAATTPFNTPVTLNVLSNDSDPNGYALSIASVTSPARGTAAVSGNMIVYTPQATFSGTDTFSYTIANGHGGSSSAAITVTVQPPNAPFAVNDSATTPYNTPVTINVLANDSDPYGFPLSVVQVSSPAQGTAQLSGKAVIYTPRASFNGGTDSFSYTVSDGHGGTAMAKVSVTVQPPGVPAANNDAATTAYNTPVTINVLANDIDPDGFALTVASVTTPAHGTAQMNGTTIVYTPQNTFYGGTDTFSYTVTNGHGGTATATVMVTVQAPPAPSATNDVATTAYNTPATINVLANDNDVNGFTLSIASVTAPAHGATLISGNAILYTPDAAFLGGTDSFAYTVSDGHGSAASANVTVTVQAPAPPVANNVSASVQTGGTISIPVLDSDSDPNGFPLSILSIGTPTMGTAQISGNQIVYTSTGTVIATDSFGYTISDGHGGTASATVTVSITGVIIP